MICFDRIKPCWFEFLWIKSKVALFIGSGPWQPAHAPPEPPPLSVTCPAPTLRVRHISVTPEAPFAAALCTSSPSPLLAFIPRSMVPTPCSFSSSRKSEQGARFLTTIATTTHYRFLVTTEPLNGWVWAPRSYSITPHRCLPHQLTVFAFFLAVGAQCDSHSACFLTAGEPLVRLVVLQALWESVNFSDLLYLRFIGCIVVFLCRHRASLSGASLRRGPDPATLSGRCTALRGCRRRGPCRTSTTSRSPAGAPPHGSRVWWLRGAHAARRSVWAVKA
jgi:hypothetical protein